jgi:hypothetical protein
MEAFTGRIWSPSATKQFLFCPVYWRLNREGWVGRDYGKLDAYGARGSGVAKAIELWNQTSDLEGSIEGLRVEITNEWEKRLVPQRAWGAPAKPEPTLAQMIREATECFVAYTNAPVDHYDIVETEYTFKDHGNARADAIIRLRNGKLIPLDYKVKAKAYTPWLEYKIREDFRNSWQMLHYCWALSEEQGRLVDEYAILILWHDKKPKIEYVPYAVDSFRLEQWYKSAVNAWARMNDIVEGRSEPTEAAEHGDKFGPCVFEAACLQHRRDPELMASDYLQIQR